AGQTRAGVEVFWPPLHNSFYPKGQKTYPAPEWCRAAPVSQLVAIHWHKPTVTRARHRHPPAARIQAIRDRSSLGPCARRRDETELPIGFLASPGSTSTCPRASPPASRAADGP